MTPEGLLDKHRVLIEKCASKACRYTHTNQDLRKDLIQNAKMKVWEGLNRPSTNIEDPRIAGYISTIAYSSSLRYSEHLRYGVTLSNTYWKNNDEIPKFLFYDNPSIEDDTDALLPFSNQSHTQMELEDVINKTELDELGQRTLIQLLAGLGTVDISKVEGVTKNAISGRKKRLINALRETAGYVSALTPNQGCPML